jgi:hypothetical protein
MVMIMMTFVQCKLSIPLILSSKDIQYTAHRPNISSHHFQISLTVDLVPDIDALSAAQPACVMLGFFEMRTRLSSFMAPKACASAETLF